MVNWLKKIIEPIFISQSQKKAIILHLLKTRAVSWVSFPNFRIFFFNVKNLFIPIALNFQLHYQFIKMWQSLSRFIDYHYFFHFCKCCLKSFLEQGGKWMNRWMDKRLFSLTAPVRTKCSPGPCWLSNQNCVFLLSILCANPPHCSECSVSHL